MRILYLCPLLPALSGNGGRRAAYNHLLELDVDGVEIDAVLVDVEDSYEMLPFFSDRVTSKVFSRAMPKFNSSNRAKILALVEHFLSRIPRAMRVIASQNARKFVEKKMNCRDYEVIIVDHFNSYGLIYGLKINIPIVYIAHNVETDVLEDQLSQIKAWKPSYWFRLMDMHKVKAMELELCRKAKHIIPISSTDANIEPISTFNYKATIWPELPTQKTTKWQPNNHKSLLFVGSSKYFPNRDAIEWLSGSLLPALRQANSNITLNIAGTASEEVDSKFHTEGVNYLGFVSNDELERLHLESTMFICPIVLGGGIKIKVLEASSYGIPIASTNESLNGIEYLYDCAIRFSRDSLSDIARIGNFLDNSDELVRLGKATSVALETARQKRVSLKGILQNADS